MVEKRTTSSTAAKSKKIEAKSGAQKPKTAPSKPKR